MYSDVPVVKAQRVLDLPRVEAEILWISGYYDGPLSGMVLYEGRMCWFETSDDPGLPKRRYFLYDLEDWEIAKITTRHFEFELYVGTHHCNHAPGPVKAPRELHRKFYDKQEYNWKVTDGKRPFAKFIRGTRKK